MSATQTTDVDLPEAGDRSGVGQALSDYWTRVRGGDVGSLPAILGLVVLVAFFTWRQGDVFFSALNFANLLNQSAGVMVIAMGLVFVLLLGEIDLSAGFTAGTAAAILAVTLTQHSWPMPLALLAALVTGLVIGLAIGLLVAFLGIPSFVVTLAGFLGLQGVMLLVIGEGGTIPIRDGFVKALNAGNMSVWAGWVLWAVVVVGYLFAGYRRIMRRRSRGLPSESSSVLLAKAASLAVLFGIAVYVLNQERQRPSAPIVIQGVPWVVLIILVLLVGLTFVLNRTAYGRHIYAVGGNAEAARRAGISVPWVRVTCFMIGSTMAAVAGILIASRDGSVSPTTGGAQTLLYAVGAAVIGGVSLFGGKGKVRDAVIGGLVIGVIANGLPLITQTSGIQFIVTGLVLLIAASVDAISRRRSTPAR